MVIVKCKQLKFRVADDNRNDFGNMRIRQVLKLRLFYYSFEPLQFHCTLSHDLLFPKYLH